MSLLNRIFEQTKVVKDFLEKDIDENNFPDNNLIKSMKYTLLADGKRLRPWLVLTSAKLCGADEHEAIRVAGAIECIHRYSLIHDDLPCFDDDDERWGLPTNHKVFGENTAIIAGDSLQTKAFEIISDERTHKDSNVRCKLVTLLANSIGYKGMCGGQEIDTQMEQGILKITEDLMIRNQIMKTGALFKFSCVSGCLLGDNNTIKIKLLEKYAYHLGLIFQMTDDLLDNDGFRHIWTEEKLKHEINKHCLEAQKTAKELSSDDMYSLIEILEKRSY